MELDVRLLPSFVLIDRVRLAFIRACLGLVLGVLFLVSANESLGADSSATNLILRFVIAASATSLVLLLIYGGLKFYTPGNPCLNVSDESIESVYFGVMDRSSLLRLSLKRRKVMGLDA